MTWELKPLRARKDGSVIARAYEGDTLRYRRRFASLQAASDPLTGAAARLAAAWERCRPKTVGELDFTAFRRHGAGWKL